MNGITYIEDRYFERFKEDRKYSVKFFAKLLFSEAFSINLKDDSLYVPEDITTSDGGIDGSFENLTDKEVNLIKKGKNYYQIKTGDLQMHTETEIKKFLFKPEFLKSKDLNQELNKDHLNKEIKKCFDNSGTLFIIHYNYENAKHSNEEIRNKMIDKLENLGYSKPRIEIRRKSDLKRVIEKYPALAFDLMEINQPFLLMIIGVKNLDL